MQSTILLSSITMAIRAQKLLESRGILANIRKITNHPILSGCGYGLELQGDVRAALAILAAGEVRVLGVV